MSSKTHWSIYVAVVVAVLAVAPVVVLYWGWVASKLWAWFIVPLGVPVLSPVQLGGVMLTVECIRHQHKTKADGTDLLIYVTLLPLGTLFVGWLFKVYFL